MQKIKDGEIKYFAYIRKSSDREDAQTLSLGAQKRELKAFAERHNLNIVTYLEESASAYKTGRPKFNKMLEEIKAGKANAILVYHLTRIARNSSDGGNVIYMMDEGSLQEIRTPEKSFYGNVGDDKFMMQIHFAMAKKSSDDTSQFVKRDIQSKILKGEYPVSAPIGYLNLDKYGRIAGIRFDNKKQEIIENLINSEGRKPKRVEQDPILAPIIKNIFEMYANETYSIDDLRYKSLEMGIKGIRNDNQLTKSTLLRMLTNPIYYGAIQWNGKLYEPDDFPEENRHIGIISKKLFLDVQKILNNKSRPRGQVHDFQYTGMMRCGECGSMITAEIKKGYIYYRCTKKKGGCSQKYLRENDFEDQLFDNMLEYIIPEEFAKWALEVLASNNEVETERRKAILAQQRSQVSHIEQQLGRLLKLKISANNINNELISDNEYLEQKKTLLAEKQTITDKLADIEQNMNNWLEQCEQFFYYAVNCEKKWKENKPKGRKLIFSFIFGSNTILIDKKVLFIAKKPFFRRALLTDSNNWRTGRDSNPRPSA